MNQEQETMTMSTTYRPANDAALSAFVTRKAEIAAMLERLAGFSDDHFGVVLDEVSWGDVANLGYVIEKLRQASDFIFQEGECAR
jgi:hypothetical protein